MRRHILMKLNRSCYQVICWHWHFQCHGFRGQGHRHANLWRTIWF